ncbi:MAG: PASTA domain-containing protein [Lentimicrobium sp.]|nr:PASTA domain-containing protein [Lentimicrobium sp.]
MRVIDQIQHRKVSNKTTSYHMKFIEFMSTRVFVRQLLLSLALTVVVISLVLWALKWYTHHGESVTVPSLIGLTPNQIDKMETISDVEIIIIDSVFDSRMPGGSVLIQDPLPGSKVKRNRKVYLTTVAVMPEKVEMPDLVDLSLRQATATLETYGLRLGNVNYIPDIAANAVLAQFHKNLNIKPGFELLKGSVIDLKVGLSTGGGRYYLPFLIGKTREEAHNLINKNLLSVGTETFDDDADPLTARVYSQNPVYSRNRLLNAGNPVSLVYKDPLSFDFESYMQQLSSDTLSMNNDSLNY